MLSVWAYLRLVITKKFFLVIIFFVLTPLVLLSSFLMLSKEEKGKVMGTMVSPISFANDFYVSLPSNPSLISYQIKTEDSRCFLVENYLKKYRSPLLPFSKLICETADKYDLDYRLLLAIAQQESNLCKSSPPDWHNCWGWGIHSKGIKKYSSYEEAIEDVSLGIKNNYCNKGYCDDPCMMMRKYTPRSNGSWCFGVKQFLKEIEEGFSS